MSGIFTPPAARVAEMTGAAKAESEKKKREQEALAQAKADEREREAAAADARGREANKKGRLSTVLTGPRGLTDSGLTLSRPSLLG